MAFPRETCAACGRSISVQAGRFTSHGDPRHGTWNFCEGSFNKPDWVRTEVALREGHAGDLPSGELATHLFAMLDAADYIGEFDTAEAAIRELARRAK